MIVPLGGANGNQQYSKLNTYTPTGAAVQNGVVINFGGGTTAQGSVYSDAVGVSNAVNAVSTSRAPRENLMLII